MRCNTNLVLQLCVGLDDLLLGYRSVAGNFIGNCCHGNFGICLRFYLGGQVPGPAFFLCALSDGDVTDSALLTNLALSLDTRTIVCFDGNPLDGWLRVPGHVLQDLSHLLFLGSGRRDKAPYLRLVITISPASENS